MKIDLPRCNDNLLRIDAEGRVLLLCPRCGVEHVGPVATPESVKDVVARLLEAQQQDTAALAAEVQRLQRAYASLREEWEAALRMSR